MGSGRKNEVASYSPLRALSLLCDDFLRREVGWHPAKIFRWSVRVGVEKRQLFLSSAVEYGSINKNKQSNRASVERRVCKHRENGKSGHRAEPRRNAVMFFHYIKIIVILINVLFRIFFSSVFARQKFNAKSFQPIPADYVAGRVGLPSDLCGPYWTGSESGGSSSISRLGRCKPRTGVETGVVMRGNHGKCRVGRLFASFSFWHKCRKKISIIPRSHSSLSKQNVNGTPFKTIIICPPRGQIFTKQNQGLWKPSSPSTILSFTLSLSIGRITGDYRRIKDFLQANKGRLLGYLVPILFSSHFHSSSIGPLLLSSPPTMVINTPRHFSPK